MAEKPTLGYKIKQALFETGTTQEALAKKLDVTQGMITHWVTGRKKPTVESLERIAEALGLTLDYFISNKDANEETIENVSKRMDWIPVLGISSATNEKFIVEEVESYIPFPKTSPKQFAIKVEGNCMEDPKDPQNSIYNGSYVIIDPETEVGNGDVVLARISKDFSTIKRMYIKDETIELIPDNPKCKTLVRKKADVEIVGKVVNLYRPIKKKRRRA